MNARTLTMNGVRLAAGVVLLSACMNPAACTAAPQPVTHEVKIDGTRYQPEALDVAAGDSVVWVNTDPFPHTVTSAGGFDSHDIAPGKSWTYTARTKGEFTYSCTYHPTMKGVLRVR